MGTVGRGTWRFSITSNQCYFAYASEMIKLQFGRQIEWHFGLQLEGGLVMYPVLDARSCVRGVGFMLRKAKFGEFSTPLEV
jgi:hypothetical protein